MLFRIAARAFAIASVVAALSYAGAVAALPSAAALGRLPAIQDAQISPDGRSVAMISGTAGQRQLSISTIDQPKAIVMDLGQVRAWSLAWAGDEYIIVRITKNQKNATMKYAYNVTRDFVFSRDGTLKTWLLNNSPESTLQTGYPLYRVTSGDKPVALMQGLDQKTDTATNNTRFSENHDILQSALFKVDVASGHGTPVQRGESYDWAIDRSGEPRGRATPVQAPTETVQSDDLQVVISGRGKGQSGWRTFSTVRKRGFNLLGYSSPEDALYWLEEDGAGGMSRIHRADLATGAVSILDTPSSKGNLGLIFDPYSDELIGTTNWYDQWSVQWKDPKLAQYSASFARLFKGKKVRFLNWSRDRSRFIVSVSDASAPTEWYLFDPARKEVSPLGSEYPEVKPTELGTKTFFTYAARDGLKIPAYLHMPPGGKDKNLPLILFPHGGPGSRDDDDFDWWAQFMTSRGYAVLQPQFRGSSGFGSDFYRAGRQEWGGKMQTDLLDGIADLARKGVIDPKRVCVVGASYGGYSALQDITAYPNDFKCAVSVNGVSDPGQLIVQLKRRFDVDSSNMLEEFGNSRGEVSSMTPIRHVDAIKGPVLLIYSANDTTVPPEQSTVMQEHLAKAGKDSTVVVLSGDDHHLMASASRIQMLTAIDAFLAKNLPANP